MQDVKRESPIPLNNYANAKGVKQFQPCLITQSKTRIFKPRRSGFPTKRGTI